MSYKRNLDKQMIYFNIPVNQGLMYVSWQEHAADVPIEALILKNKGGGTCPLVSYYTSFMYYVPFFLASS